MPDGRHGDGVGVTITLREIYDKIVGVGEGVARLDERVANLERKASDAETAAQQSADAMKKAKDALKLAEELKKNQRWLWQTFVGAIIVGGVTLLITKFG